MNRTDVRKQVENSYSPHQPPGRGMDAEDRADTKGGGSRPGLKAGGHVSKPEAKHDHETVSSGRGIKTESVEAENVIGDGGKVRVKGAEGETDMASSKGNRHEAMEPERERDEKAAMGREKTVGHKNTMGHGERETKAQHTI